MHKDQGQETADQNAQGQRKTHHEATGLLLLLVDHLRREAHIDPRRIAVRQRKQSHVQQAEHVGTDVRRRDRRSAHQDETTEKHESNLDFIGVYKGREIVQKVLGETIIFGFLGNQFWGF
jgi:hypothetical protein